MQQLIFAEVNKDAQKILNVGLTNKLDSPFNLFVNFDHLVDVNKRYIYLYIYSMGKKRIAGWGVYDRVIDSFELSGVCRYLTQQLYSMTKNWMAQGFKYVGNAVTDRPSALIAKYLDQPIMTYDDYKKSKHLIACYQNDITYEELEAEYPGLWDQAEDKYPDGLDFIDYMEELKRHIELYESTINRVDLDFKAKGHPLRKMLEYITEKFYSFISKSKISGEGYEKLLKECPYLDQCKMDRNIENCEVNLGYTHPEDIDYT